MDSLYKLMDGLRLNVGSIKRKSNTTISLIESSLHICLCGTEATVL